MVSRISLVLIGRVMLAAGLVMLGTGWSAVAQSPPLRLYGVVIGAGTQAVAYLQDPGTGRVRGFRIGDTIGDGRVIGIEPDRVVVQRDGETVQVRLGAGGADPGARPGAPPAGTVSPAPPLCPPFGPPPAAADAAESAAPAPAAPALPCPPFCPAPAPGSPEAAPAPGSPGPRPASQLPCPPFCPAKP